MSESEGKYGRNHMTAVAVETLTKEVERLREMVHEYAGWLRTHRKQLVAAEALCEQADLVLRGADVITLSSKVDGFNDAMKEAEA